MNYPPHLVFLILFTKCVAVNIKKLSIPSLVETGVDVVTLDCDYDLVAATRKSELVVKWFINENSLVYQWIPPLQPQVVGLLKDKIDRSFKVSEEPLKAYRALRIQNPTTDLSGNYTCVVSTFSEEDRQTKSMLVYSTGKNLHFYQEKKYVFLVTLICVAEDLYPKPVMYILAQSRKPLNQATSEVKMNSWGLYSITMTAVVHDNDIEGELEEFVCELRLPPANYTVTRRTIYYPGLMPTIQTAAVEIAQKPQEQHANCSWSLSSIDTKHSLFYYILTTFILFKVKIN